MARSKGAAVVEPTDESESTDGSTLTAIDSLTVKEIKALELKEKRSDLRKLETIVTKGDKALPIMVEALMEIRERRLYKLAKDPETGKGFSSFDRYLQSHTEWGFTRQYASKLIKSHKDALAIEAGQEPEPREVRGARPIDGSQAAAKVWTAFEQFASRGGTARDACTDDEFIRLYDDAYRQSEILWSAFVKAFPAPVAEVSPLREDDAS